MKKITITQWFTQFFLAFFVTLLAFRYAPYLARGGSTGQILRPIFFATVLGITVALVVGDISLYAGQSLSLLGVVTALFLGACAFVFVLFFGGLMPSFHVGKIGDIISFISCFSTVIAPPLVGYNMVSFLSRRYASQAFARKLNAQLCCGFLFSLVLSCVYYLWWRTEGSFIWKEIVFLSPVLAASGIVFADLYFGKKQEYNIFLVILAVVTGFILGEFAAYGIFTLFGRMKGLVSLILYLPIITACSLGGYNTMVYFGRERWAGTRKRRNNEAMGNSE